MRIIYYILLILISNLFAHIPYGIDLNGVQQEILFYNSYEEGLLSNNIVNLEIYNDSTIYLGTTNGLHIGYYTLGQYNFGNFNNNSNMPIGGNPALVVKGDIISVSGVGSVLESTGMESAGTGISYSVDGGLSWKYMPQSRDRTNALDPNYTNLYSCPWGPFDEFLYTSRDECDDNCYNCDGSQSSCQQYNHITWGGQDHIINRSVTTEVLNISYGIAIHGDYIYTASWAGSLRRFDYTLDEPIWEIVPLPMDNQLSLSCNDINITNYQVNPVGNYVDEDCGYEFDNHKVFSVLSVEDTLWVGTAKGVNKGVVDENNCIDWTRFTSDENGLYDDWIIGFLNQLLENGTNRIWAITWDRRYAGSHKGYGGPPSYSDNGGQNWTFPENLHQNQIITYNISSNEDEIYISSDKGLYISNSNSSYELWDKLVLPDYVSSSVYDVERMDIFNDLWVGSHPLIVLDEESNDFRYISANENIQNIFYSYPNPFYIDEREKVYFSFNGDENNVDGDVSIYDFSMDRVISLSIGGGLVYWDGKNEYGDQVANGIYTCLYTHSDDSKYYFNIMVINSR